MAKFENEKFKYDKYDYKQIEINGVITKVYRIISKINFSTINGMVVAGKKGGYCALNTLSEKGNCWVDEYSVVGPNCHVGGRAYIERALLAHDVSVGGRAYVYNSQINPNKEAAIFEDAKVINSKVKGDLHMNGFAKLESSIVDGNLKMEAETQLTTCLLKTKDRISMVRNTKLAKREVEGSGTIGINEEITLNNIDFSKIK